MKQESNKAASRKLLDVRIFAILAVILLSVTAVAIVASAEDSESEAAAADAFGPSISHSYSGTTLTLMGSGEMTDFQTYSKSNSTRQCSPAVNFPDVTKIVIGEGITTVGSYCFNLNYLVEIEFPSSMRIINTRAFHGCNSLTTLTFTEGITTINDFAFQAGYALTTVNLPDSLTSIGTRAFNACTHLTSINVSVDSPNFQSIDGVLYNKALTAIACVPEGKTGTIALPTTIQSVPAYAFCGSNATTIILNDGITTIGYYAFSGSKITQITIPSTVTTLDSDGMQFFNSSYLTTVYLPSTITIIPTYAFSNCDALTSITIPSSITDIQLHAFASCDNLTQVIFESETAPSLGQNAFNLNNSNSIKVVAPSAFSMSGFNANVLGGNTVQKVVKNEVEYDLKCISGSTYTYNIVTDPADAVVTKEYGAPWLSVSGHTLSGTVPIVSGISTYEVCVKASKGTFYDYQTFTLTVYPLIAITGPDSIIGIRGTTIEDCDSNANIPVTWSLVSGSLPSGLTLNTSTGVISGTPTQSRNVAADITIKAVSTDIGATLWGTKNISIRIMDPINITTTPSSQYYGTSKLYTYPVASNIDSYMTVTWTVSSDQIGVGYDSATHSIRGTIPATLAPKAYTFVITASTVHPTQSCSQTVTVNIQETVTITSLPTAGILVVPLYNYSDGSGIGIFGNIMRSTMVSAADDESIDGGALTTSWYKFVYVGENATSLKWTIYDEAGNVIRESTDWTLVYHFEKSGIYTIEQIATNELGEDRVTTTVEVELPPNYGMTEFLILCLIFLVICYAGYRFVKRVRGAKQVKAGKSAKVAYVKAPRFKGGRR